MKAKEARDKALNIQSQRINSEYNQVKKEISERVNDGKLSATVDGTLGSDVILLLEEEGYTLRHFQSGMNEYSYEIKW